MNFIEQVSALLDRLRKKTVKSDSQDELLQLLHSTWTEITKSKIVRHGNDKIYRVETLRDAMRASANY